MSEQAPVIDFIDVERQAAIGIVVFEEVINLEADLVATIGQAVVETETQEFLVFNVENDPDIKAVRAEARKEAESIMEANLQLLCEGEFDRVPLEADAGGTARKLVAIGRVFGQDSPEYQQGWEGLLRDCGRRVGEANRVNGWELFDETEMELDAETELFFSDGYCVDEILKNGLTPATNPACPEEGPRRINEYVEVKTDAALLAKPYMNGRSTYTLSQCPQSLIDRHQRNPKQSVYSDYVPAIQKLMVRGKRFDPIARKIYLRQMAVPGTYINNEVINIVLSEMDVTDGDRQLDRTEVHGTQAVVSNEVVKDVVAMVRRLDQAASEYHGTIIYLGQPFEQGQEVDYEGVYAEAANRRCGQEDLTLRYALKLVELEEAGLDREFVKHEADEFIRAELLKIAEKSPDKAEMMFNPETAEGFREANRLEAEGRLREALDLRATATKNAPPAGGCGAGTCGLDNPNASENKAAKGLLGPDGKIIKDSERPCPKCGEKQIVYKVDEKTGALISKGCLGCGANEGAKPQAADKRNSSLLSFIIRRPQTRQVVTIAGGKVKQGPSKT
jgi:hypothetical protein